MGTPRASGKETSERGCNPGCVIHLFHVNFIEGYCDDDVIDAVSTAVGGTITHVVEGCAHETRLPHCSVHGVGFPGARLPVCEGVPCQQVRVLRPLERDVERKE